MKYSSHVYTQNRQKFLPHDVQGCKIHLGVSNEFNSRLQNYLSEKNVYYYDFYTVVPNRVYSIFYSVDWNILWSTSTEVTKDDVEYTLFKQQYLPGDLLHPMSIFYSKRMELLDNISLYKDKIKGLKRDLNNTVAQHDKSKELLHLFDNSMDILKKLPIEDGQIMFKFDNVIAEDTDVEGEDIDLGSLKFHSDFNGNVKIVEGTYEYRTEYCANAFHPHQMADGICLGSQSGDFVEAIGSFNYSVAQAILYKFAHSYTSSDSAGNYWKKWAGLDMSDPEIYVETRNGYYDEDDVIWDDRRNEYIHCEDAVFSTYLDEYIYINDSVWSDYHVSEMLESDCVISHTGDYIHTEEVVYYDDLYYAQEECVKLINGYFVPEYLTVTNSDGEFILKEDAVEIEGNWYHQDDEFVAQSQQENA